MVAHVLCKHEAGVRFSHGPPNLFRLDIHGEYARLLTGEGWFDPNRRSQIICVRFVEYVWPSKPKDAGSNPVARSKFVGISPSWSKALVFEISIVGSNPTIPAKF